MTTYDNYHRKYYLENRERILARQLLVSRSRRQIPEKVTGDNENRRKKYKEHPELELFKNAMNRARRKGIEFSINVSDIKIPTRCPYLDIELVGGTYTDRKRGASPTIDRIDPTIGYTPSNIEVISDLANRMKQNATPEQLIKFAESIISRYKYNNPEYRNLSRSRSHGRKFK